VQRDSARPQPAVFISYAHEGDLGERVLELALWLREHEIEVHTDHLYKNRPPEEGWRAWMQHHIESDDVVMIVCTKRYKELFEKQPVDDGRGFGVSWEGAIITAELYNSRLHNSRYFPILPDGGDPSHVPKLLQDWNNNHRFPSGKHGILALIRNDDPMATIDRQPSSLAEVQGGRAALSRENPFGDRGCIRDPTRFFNRGQELAEIFDELRKGSSLSLVGEAQVGKSSLLAMIAARGPEALKRDSSQIVTIDMQVIRNEDEFFDALCEKLGLGLTVRGLHLERALRGRQVVVCLDEIEKMTNPQCFSGGERTELRGHANGSDTPLTLVIASRSPLAHLFDDDPRNTSPLADLCGPPQRIGPFSPATSEAFLLHRLQGNAVSFSPSQRKWLHEQSQGHPGKLQGEAAALYRQLARS
jgi:hypothetical protein